MAFRASKYSARDTKYGLMANNQAFTIGEVIIPSRTSETPTLLTGGGTTSYLLGSVLGFKDTAGSRLGFDTVTAAADNVTVALVQAAYLPLHICPEWITDLSAAAGTTAGSSTMGNMSVNSTGLFALESTWVIFTTHAGATQLFSYGLTGKNTTQITCSFYATINGALA